MLVYLVPHRQAHGTSGGTARSRCKMLQTFFSIRRIRVGKREKLLRISPFYVCCSSRKLIEFVSWRAKQMMIQDPTSTIQLPDVAKGSHVRRAKQGLTTWLGIIRKSKKGQLNIDYSIAQTHASLWSHDAEWIYWKELRCRLTEKEIYVRCSSQ